jgi:hypothetical protein
VLNFSARYPATETHGQKNAAGTLLRALDELERLIKKEDA